ncbi:hypothetical protein PoB_006443000 [Plakobranchus ocellatus]|uniref:Uncharacterized protein n=1 Tax=Plakobranchus ocellatus TaxID=259542 RepID=A0AAV4D1G5_9GAST|nr:hypothetical protein PoB_006443000 [Plakobranchus ocellatus]
MIYREKTRVDVVLQGLNKPRVEGRRPRSNRGRESNGSRTCGSNFSPRDMNPAAKVGVPISRRSARGYGYAWTLDTLDYMRITIICSEKGLVAHKQWPLKAKVSGSIPDAQLRNEGGVSPKALIFGLTEAAMLTEAWK